MPKSTMEEKDPYKLPKDVPLPAKLEKVELRVVDFVYKKGPQQGEAGQIRRWKWEFSITEGEYAGLHAWGETDDFVSRTTDGTTNKAAQWCETLRGQQIQLGEGIDTDDLLGLPAALVVDHTSRERSDGQGTFYEEPVVDLFPIGVLADMASAGPSEPPF